jgi:hypothetical protein
MTLELIESRQLISFKNALSVYTKIDSGFTLKQISLSNSILVFMNSLSFLEV